MVDFPYGMLTVVGMLWRWNICVIYLAFTRYEKRENVYMVNIYIIKGLMVPRGGKGILGYDSMGREFMG